MYDRVSAVLAELIANAYDAEAENVTIDLPFGKYLAKRIEDEVEDQGFEIIIEDDGSGMTAQDVNDYYLNVGYNRRAKRGERTRNLKRKVMGRKGIGKLAPFGICREVEIITSGGTRAEDGFTVSNFILDMDEMLVEEMDDNGNVEPYHPIPGDQDGKFANSTGTKLILRNFDKRRVPTREELDRQLAARFGLSQDNWKVTLTDSTSQQEPIELGTLNIDTMPGTCIDVGDRPIKLSDDELLPVTGWVAYSKDPYRDEVMAGVRIYSRGKIVAQTRDFDIKSGFTGEFKMRSYLTGAINAEWLDDNEDLVRTDRQDIIWNSDSGSALREWGQNLLKELAARAETSVRKRIWDVFLENSHLEERLQNAHPNDSSIRSSVLRAARLLVSRADRDSVEKSSYANRIVRLAYAVGPHSDLLHTLDQIASLESGSVDDILDLFERVRLAETYSLGQVAQERVRVIKQLEALVSRRTTIESELQRLIETAPWLLYPNWTTLSQNQSLATTRGNFESWYLAKHGKEITTAPIIDSRKQPDFVMLNHEGRLEVVEIKRPQHKLTDVEFKRAYNYLKAVQQFIESSPEVKVDFSKAKLSIVCDELNLEHEYADLIDNSPDITCRTWHDLLRSTTRIHENFLEVVTKMQGELPDISVE